MPTRKAPRTATDPTEGKPVVVTTQTLLAPRAEGAASGEAQQPLRETARQTEETARPTGTSTDGRAETLGSEVMLDAVVAR
eukprot:14989532-Alexandrium_andersonii.AAC.1